MRFFYDSELLCEIRTLEKFSSLSELCLNGGDFNKDPLRQLFENIGHQLTKLEFLRAMAGSTLVASHFGSNFWFFQGFLFEQ